MKSAERTQKHIYKIKETNRELIKIAYSLPVDHVLKIEADHMCDGSIIFDVFKHKSLILKSLKTIGDLKNTNLEEVVENIRCLDGVDFITCEKYVRSFLRIIEALNKITLGDFPVLIDPDKVRFMFKRISFEEYIKVCESLSLKERVYFKLKCFSGIYSWELIKLKVKNVSVESQSICFRNKLGDLSSEFLFLPKHIFKDLKKLIGKRKGFVFFDDGGLVSGEPIYSSRDYLDFDNSIREKIGGVFLKLFDRYFSID